MTLTILDLGFGLFGDQVAWESGTGEPGKPASQLQGEASARGSSLGLGAGILCVSVCVRVCQ